MSKRITCKYQLSEPLLGEYVRQLKHSSRILYGALGIVLVVAGTLGLSGMVAGIFAPPLLLVLGIALFISMVLYSDPVMTKRMASRYKSRFGGVDIPVRVSLDSGITYTLNGHELCYRYDSIDTVVETDSLIVINYPTNAVLMAKEGLPAGIGVADVKELIFRHVSIAKNLKEERRFSERRAIEGKRREKEERKRARREAKADDDVQALAVASEEGEDA